MICFLDEAAEMARRLSRGHDLVDITASLRKRDRGINEETIAALMDMAKDRVKAHEQLKDIMAEKQAAIQRIKLKIIDQLAASVCASMLANPSVNLYEYELVAQSAYAMAEAMEAERERRAKTEQDGGTQ